MDPDTCLERIRDLIRLHHRRGALHLADTADLCEHVEALDEWLSKGGHFPSAWVPTALDRVAIQQDRRPPVTP